MNNDDSPLMMRSVSSLIFFAFKTCIVVAAIIFVVSWVIDSLESSATRVVDKVHDQIEASMRLGGPKFWAKVERELDHAADNSSDLTPEKKQKLIHDIRVIVARWHPFVEAAQTEMNTPVEAKKGH